MPLTLKSQVTRVLYLLENGECRQAVIITGRILSTYPLCILAYSLIARAYLGLGEFETAEKLFERVLSADPEDAVAHMSLGILNQTYGLSNTATDYLLRAYELAPGDVQVRQALHGLAHSSVSAVPDAFPMSRAGLARTLLRGGLYEQAIDEFGLLVKQWPQRTDLWVALCEAYWLDQQFTPAATTAQHVLHMAPFCLKANLILGQIWLNSKRENEARIYLEQAQALDPENRWAQLVLGRFSSLPLRVIHLSWDDSIQDEPEPEYLRNIDSDEVFPE